MPQFIWNVKNTVTNELILNADGTKKEYETEDLAMNAAVYYTTTTGQVHNFVGPNPKNPR